MNVFSSEKRRYWEGKLRDILNLVQVEDILLMSWAIEAMRDGREVAARRFVNYPGEAKDYKIGGKFFIPPWSVDAVIREKLYLGSSDGSKKIINLRNWNNVARLFNAYAGLANAESLMDYSPSEIVAAMPRIFWPQYDWQIGVSGIYRIGRAWHVYATDEGNAAFFEKHGVGLETFVKAAFGIVVGVDNHPSVKPDLLSSIGVSSLEMYRVRKIIGNSIKEHFDWAKDNYDPNVPRDFQRNPIKERPIFELQKPHGPTYYVPSRESLLLRITDGLYYDIVSNSDARRRSGEAFEQLCFKIIKHYLNDGLFIQSEQPTKYGVSADILVEDKVNSSGIIVECKIRRIPRRVFVSPDPFNECEDDFEDIVKGIVQIWRTYDDLYRSLAWKMVGVVLQYDPWTIMGKAFIKELFELAHKKAESIGVPVESRIPVALVGYYDFEQSLRSYSHTDIFDAVTTWATDEFYGWELVSILRKRDIVAKKPVFDYRELAVGRFPWWGGG